MRSTENPISHLERLCKDFFDANTPEKKRHSLLKNFFELMDEFSQKTKTSTSSHLGFSTEAPTQKKPTITTEEQKKLITDFQKQLINKFKDKKDIDSFRFLCEFSKKYDFTLDLSKLSIENLDLKNHKFEFNIILNDDQYKALLSQKVIFSKGVSIRQCFHIQENALQSVNLSHTTFSEGVSLDADTSLDKTTFYKSEDKLFIDNGRGSTKTMYTRHPIVPNNKPIIYNYKLNESNKSIQTTPSEILPHLQKVFKNAYSQETFSSSQIFFMCFSRDRTKTLTAFAELLKEKYQKSAGTQDRNNAFIELMEFSKAHQLPINLSSLDIQKTDLIEKIKERDPFKNCQLDRNQVTWLLMKGYGALLKGANLTGLDLSGLDFSRLDLSETDFSQSNLEGAKFNRAILHGSKFDSATIKNADFESAKFNSQTNFELCIADNKTNISHTDIDASQFTSLKNGGKNLFEDCNISINNDYLGYIEDCKFINTNLYLASNTNLTIRKSNFTNCGIISDRDASPVVNFSNTTLEKTRFVRDCSEIKMDIDCKLMECDFQETSNTPPIFPYYSEDFYFGQSTLEKEQFNALLGLDLEFSESSLIYGNRDIYLQNVNFSSIELSKDEKEKLAEKSITLHLNFSKFNIMSATEHPIKEAQEKLFKNPITKTQFKIAFKGTYTNEYNNFNNVDISELTLSDPSILLTASLIGARLNRAQVVYLIGRGQTDKLRNTDLSGCDLSHLNLTAIDFKNIKIDGYTNFTGTKLRYRDLPHLKEARLLENATILFEKNITLSEENISSISTCKIQFESPLSDQLPLPTVPYEIDSNALIDAFNKNLPSGHEKYTKKGASAITILRHITEANTDENLKKAAVLAFCALTKKYNNIDAAGANFFNQDLSGGSLRNAILHGITISFGNELSTNLRNTDLTDIQCDNFTCIYNGEPVSINTKDFVKRFYTTFFNYEAAYNANVFKIFQEAQENPNRRTAKILNILLEQLSFEQTAKIEIDEKRPIDTEELETISSLAEKDGLDQTQICRAVETLSTNATTVERNVYRHKGHSSRIPLTMYSSPKHSVLNVKHSVLNVEGLLIFNSKDASTNTIEPKELKRALAIYKEKNPKNSMDCIQMPIALPGRKHYVHLQIYKKDEQTIGARIIDSSGRAGLPGDEIPEAAVKKMIERNIATFESLFATSKTKVHTSVVSTNVQYTDKKCGLYVFGGIKATTDGVLANGPDFLRSDAEVKRTIQAEHKMVDNTQPDNYLRVRTINKADQTAHAQTSTAGESAPSTGITAPPVKPGEPSSDSDSDFVLVEHEQTIQASSPNATTEHTSKERKKIVTFVESATTQSIEDTSFKNFVERIEKIDKEKLVSILQGAFSLYKETHRQIGVSFFRQFFDAGKNYMHDAEQRLSKAPEDKKESVAKQIAKEILAQGYDKQGSLVRKPNSRVDCLLKAIDENPLENKTGLTARK